MIAQNNPAFIKRISPNRVILVAFVIWVLLFLISPLKVNIELDVYAYVFIFLSFLSFFLGGSLYKSKQNNRKIFLQRKVQAANINSKFKLIFIIACIGLLLKLLDRFILRGISLEANFDENREVMVAAGGNPIGILASFLAPFCYFPLFIFYKYKLPINRFMKFLVYFLFFGQLFDSILLSSRSAIFVNIVFLLLYLFYFKVIKLTRKRIIWGIVLALIFTIVMGYVYIQRTTVFAGDDAYELILYTSNFNFTITSTSAFLSFFHSLPLFYKGLAVIYVTTIQYFVHGMFEFSYAFQHFNAYNHSFGKYTFITFYRFWTILSGSPFDASAITNLSPRIGVYTTLFGPFFIDFGWFNLIFMLFLGYIIKSLYYKAIAGKDWAILMYFYVFIVLAFWPVFNFVNGAGGVFIFTSIIIYYIIEPKTKIYEA